MRLLLRRKQLNYSQERVAGMLGPTFQQIQKYERGANRIGASRLWDFSRILRVSVEYFFQGMEEDAINRSPPMNFHTVEEVQKMAESFFPAVDPMLSNENIRLINAVDNPKIARPACELLNEIKQNCRYGRTEEEAAGRKRECGQGADKGAEKVCRG